MAGILVHSADEGVHISAEIAKRLVEAGHGDAALLYIALLRRHGTVPPRALAGELRWEKERIEAAEAALRRMGLLKPEELPEPADEKPEYRQSDIAEKLEGSEEFRILTAQVERRLGKKLTTPDIAVLLGLSDYVGLPNDVIFLLVCHCAQRVEHRYGEGRRPTLRQIEKEGYAWSRMGIDTQEAATAYLKKYNQRQGAMPAYMRALNLGDRLPVASEEKYLAAWQEWGFSPEAVALACDKTVLKCHELKWPYCNGILKRWHEAGLHTLAEIEANDRPAPKAAPKEESKNDNAWMKRFIQQRQKEV